MRWVHAGIAAILLLAGCAQSPSERFTQKIPPLYEEYKRGIDNMRALRYRSALDSFRLVDQHYPYSLWARRARLMSAYAYYKLRQCDLAAATIDSFLELYPLDARADYARYIRSQCFFEEISDVRLDQELAGLALRYMEEVKDLHPETPYAQDVRQKIIFARHHVAAKEMYTGRLYQRRGELTGAINRFQGVIDDFPSTSLTDEARYRLLESFAALGQRDLARQMVAELNVTAPRSIWYERAYRLLEQIERGDYGKPWEAQRVY